MLGDWWQALLGAAVAIGGALIAAAIWIVQLGSRITSLEAKVADVEHTVLDEQRDLVNEIKAIRDDIVDVSKQLASSREEALRYFAGNVDVQRLEDKMDQLRGAISHQTAPRRRPGS